MPARRGPLGGVGALVPEPVAFPVPEPVGAPVPEPVEGTPPVSPTLSRFADGSSENLGDSGQHRPSGTGRAWILTRLRPRIQAWLATGRWKRPRYLVGGIAAVLLVGVLIGWAIPRPPDAGLALRSGEAAREAAVEAANDDLDPGSLLLLAREHDALLWYATQANGQLLCAILDVDGMPSLKQCVPPGQITQQPLGVSNTQAGVASGDGYSGTILLSGRGVPFGVLNRFQMIYDAGQGMSSEEREAMKRVVDENRLAYAQIVGRVGKVPVWLGDDGTGNRCLVVEERAMQKTCAPSAAVSVDPFSGEEKPAISMRLVETTAHPAVRLDFWAPPYAGQYLVITPDEGEFLVHPG